MGENVFHDCIIEILVCESMLEIQWVEARVDGDAAVRTANNLDWGTTHLELGLPFYARYCVGAQGHDEILG